MCLISLSVIVKTKPQVFLEICTTISQLSKDPSSKFGCVITGPSNEVLSVGYNSFPRGIDDTNSIRFERPEKYYWFEHAERNAIYNAARVGTKLEGASLYISGLPCMDCARAIIQAGIKKVFYYNYTEDYLSRWKEHIDRTVVLLGEGGVELVKVEP